MPVIVLMLMLGAAQAPVPVVDGRIGAEEWAGASKQALVGGGELYLLPQEDFLYVAVRGPATGLASLCVVSGGRVRILHASAAVGEGVYEKDGASWARRTNLTWALRDSRAGGPTDADRAAFFGKYGWLANASAAGSPEREFKIRRAEVEAIGVTFLSMAGLTVSYWPATIDDDCREVKVPQGYLPVTATFRPDRWHAVSGK